MTENDDSPVYTWTDVTAWIHGFLAMVGVLAASAIVALWYAGFFGWLINKIGG